MYIFGQGSGHLPAEASEVASYHGAELVNYTDPQCQCGYGCESGTCQASRRHWFTVRDMGEPHNSKTARVVLDAIKALK